MTNNNAEHWTELATAAQKGDKRAYAELLGELAPYIRNVIIKSLKNQEEAEDIAQEVLISVHKSLHTYSSDRPFKPWLMSIINFRRTDFLRKYYSSRQDKTISSDASIIEENVTNMTTSYEIRDIEKALNKFSADQQRIFKMIKIEGYTAKEVSNEMGMKESAVKVSAHRTMKKLQGMLK